MKEKRKFVEICIRTKLDGRRMKNNGERGIVDYWSSVYEEREESQGKWDGTREAGGTLWEIPGKKY